MIINKARKLFHSSIRIAGEKIVYVDPWQVQGDPHDADLVLVSHDHPDHYSPEDIAKIAKEGTVVVVPACMKDAAPEATACVEPGKQYVFCGVTVETVAAYNIGRPFHAKEKNYVGYVVEQEGVRYYIAGDTDLIPENADLKCDVALVPVGGKFTMDSAQAAELVNRIRPAIAVPTHYGPVTDSFAAPAEFSAAVIPEITVEIHE